MLIDKLQQTADGLFEASSHPEKTHLIGDLGRLVGLDANTVRFYERAGLIAPERLGRMRIYRDSDVKRLQLIRYLRKIGLPLSKIKIVLSATATGADFEEANGEVQRLLEDHLRQLRKNLMDLQGSIESLARLVPRSGEDIETGARTAVA